ncbi:proline-rich proteoglycan 2-like [Eschrichtius robustus]|uniref:proline-rich proteoglycan 2-like n=1 Tax=Eschrichtius robustus TaxID=9764 RepID=UPI0035BEF393
MAGGQEWRGSWVVPSRAADAQRPPTGDVQRPPAPQGPLLPALSTDTVHLPLRSPPGQASLRAAGVGLAALRGGPSGGGLAQGAPGAWGTGARRAPSRGGKPSSEPAAAPPAHGAKPLGPQQPPAPGSPAPGREPQSHDEHCLHRLGHETPQRRAVVLPLCWELDARATQACHVGTPEAQAPPPRPQDPSVPQSPQPCGLKSAGPGPQAAGHTGLTAGLEERPPASHGLGSGLRRPSAPAGSLPPAALTDAPAL